MFGLPGFLLGLWRTIPQQYYGEAQGRAGECNKIDQCNRRKCFQNEIAAIE